MLACVCVCVRVLASTNDHRRILFCTTCVVFFKGASVATTYNVCVCACEYVEVHEGENNLKLPVSPLLSEHVLSFLNEGQRWPSFFPARYAPVDCVEC